MDAAAVLPARPLLAEMNGGDCYMEYTSIDFMDSLSLWFCLEVAAPHCPCPCLSGIGASISLRLSCSSRVSLVAVIRSGRSVWLFAHTL